jgi:hypothetical protein
MVYAGSYGRGLDDNCHSSKNTTGGAPMGVGSVEWEATATSSGGDTLWRAMVDQPILKDASKSSLFIDKEDASYRKTIWTAAFI